MIDTNKTGEEPIFVLQKNAEKTSNKIRLPQIFVNNWGSKYYMEIYSDKIVLKPINRREE